MSDFAALGVLPEFAEKLAARSITLPTAIQRKVIPPLLGGRSVVFRSATGTGKTFAYLLPMLQRLAGNADAADAADAAVGRQQWPALVICAPTHELSAQIKAELDFLSPLPSALLIGSASLNRQIDSLKKTRPLAVVGNPGRLLALAKMGKLKFGGLRFLVLDEADRMAAAESIDETRELLQLVSRSLQRAGDGGSFAAAVCSATVTAATAALLAPMLPALRGAETVESDEHEILRERIEHWALFSESRRTEQTLRSFLAAAKPKKALVFAGRSDMAGKIVAGLQYHHVAAAGLYGDMDKQARKQALEHFRSGKIAVLVSSDLAARGLDIPALSHVIALGVPHDAEAYIHRAGRTGRAGKRGVMVSIGDEAEMRRLAALEKKLGITVYPKELYNGRVCAPVQEKNEE